MKVKELKLSKGLTVGMPNYGSCRVDQSITVQLEDGDEVSKVYSKAKGMCDQMLNHQLKDMASKLRLKGGAIEV